MKVLFIHTPTLELDNFLPPLGVLYLASILRNRGHEVKLIDKDPGYFDFIPKIRRFNPDMIGLSFMTPSYKKASVLCNHLREEFPNTILFSGGAHTSVLPENMVKNLNLDFAVFGEAEDTITEVCDRIRDKKSLKNVKGIVFRDKGEIKKNNRREFIQDLDRIPFPSRDILNFKKDYLVYPGIIRGFRCKSTTVITSRGCPYNCIYCGSTVMFGKRVRYRSIPNIISEIKHLIDLYGIEGIWFADDTFTVNHKRVIKFCRSLKKENLDFIWACQARVNTVSDAVLKEMKSAGCVQLDFGVESGSEKVLNTLKKGTNPAMIQKAFKLTKKNKIRALATFMVNNPFETKKDLIKTFKLAKEISADFTTFFYATPLPGTEMYDLAEKHGWLKGTDDYSETWNYRNAQLPVMNNDNNLTREEIMSIRSKMQNYFFIKNYIRVPNMLVGLNILYNSIKNPKVFLEAIKKVLKTGKLDQAFEVIMAKSKLN